MKDKNGKEIKHGDTVKIENGYFKADNGTFQIVHAPGDNDWSGNDYCLYRLNKNGSISNSKYNIAFWPLMVTVSSFRQRCEAKQHNAQYATIEVLTETI